MHEQVQENIAKLSHDYNKQSKIPDRYFIEQIMDILVNAYKINAYVGRIYIDNKDNKLKSRYYYISKNISMNMLALMSFYHKEGKICGFNEENKKYLLYLGIVKEILHELEHARQCQKCDLSENDVETMIIKACLSYLDIVRDKNAMAEMVSKGYKEEDIYNKAKEEQQRYQAWYSFSPTERLAEHYAYTAMIDLLKKYPEMDNMLTYYLYRLCNGYSLGYYINGEFITYNPTKFYLSEIGKLDVYPQIAAASANLDLSRKLSLGLEIKEDERDYLTDTIIELQEILLK